MNPDREQTLDQVGHHARGDLERGAVSLELVDEVVAVAQAIWHAASLRPPTGVADRPVWSLSPDLYP